MFLKYLEPQDKEAFYTLATLLMSSDGVIADAEEALLGQFLMEMEIDKPELMPMEAALASFAPAPKAIKKQVYIELAGLALCDEDYAADEAALMNQVAEHFEITEDAAELKACVDELLALYKKMGELIAR